jgi:2,3-bisphosphoglycerate-independent phosphoglycerate mutase
MNRIDRIISELCMQTDAKIVLLVMDGLGDLPRDGMTPLEAAVTPHLDRLASGGACGLTDPVSMGITPGSGPSHLALFGYDPTTYQLGRGILEALGVDVDVGPDDLVARGNFATLKGGLIVDRRAGRIPTEENQELCRTLNAALSPIDGAGISVYPGKEHRFVVKFTRRGLRDALSDADPQKEQKPRTYAKALEPEAEETALLVNGFLDRATEILQGREKANTVLVRGFARFPSIPTLQERFKLRPAAIANYPMYKGLARLVGMEVLEVGPELPDLFSTLEQHYSDFDFFYVHVKKTDAAGEDGDAAAKTEAITRTDTFIPRITSLKPDVLVVTSDHSTPCLLKSHSWHPNPILIHAATAQPDRVTAFSERACSQGYLGRFPALNAMALMLAHSGKLKKYGA